MSLTLYHGSPEIVEVPEYGKGSAHNDYGRGFYCTEHVELAREWACPEPGADGYANEYELDDAGLVTLDLSADGFTAMHWLALLLENRLFDVKYPVAEQGKAYILDVFRVDTASCDLIRGWRADDSYFSFARAFLQNGISYEQLVRAMRLGDLGEQVVLVSPEAFGRISFTGAHVAPARVYHPKRLARDETARKLYRQIAGELGIGGLFLRDMILEGIGADDARLR